MLADMGVLPGCSDVFGEEVGSHGLCPFLAAVSYGRCVVPALVGEHIEGPLEILNLVLDLFLLLPYELQSFGVG